MPPSVALGPSNWPPENTRIFTSPPVIFSSSLANLGIMRPSIALGGIQLLYFQSAAPAWPVAKTDIKGSAAIAIQIFLSVMVPSRKIRLFANDPVTLAHEARQKQYDLREHD